MLHVGILQESRCSATGRFGLANLVRDIVLTSELRDKKRRVPEIRGTIKDVVGRLLMTGTSNGV